MRKEILTLIAGLTMSTMALGAENGRYGLGLGLGLGSSLYKGAETKAYPVPMLDVDYNDFYIKGIEIGYRFYENTPVSLDVFLDPLSGYGVKGNDLGKGYDNIDERKPQVMVGLAVNYDPRFEGAIVRASVMGGENGAKSKLSLLRPIVIDPTLVIVPGIHANFYSADFVDYYFGVTTDEAIKNKHIDKSYSPNSGYSLGLGFALEKKLTAKVSLMSFASIEKFSDEITDSPIVDKSYVLVAGVGAKYFF
ncbi:MAG: MipA/OmpV family protein [Cetobacterium sp.]|uniref:MipA/OmpV family protein n=1 Tax=Cetobacterium sp. TaxID=2071632 RepID=UPI002FCB1675